MINCESPDMWTVFTFFSNSSSRPIIKASYYAWFLKTILSNSIANWDVKLFGETITLPAGAQPGILTGAG